MHYKKNIINKKNNKKYYIYIKLKKKTIKIYIYINKYEICILIKNIIIYNI